VLEWEKRPDEVSYMLGTGQRTYLGIGRAVKYPWRIPTVGFAILPCRLLSNCVTSKEPAAHLIIIAGTVSARYKVKTANPSTPVLTKHRRCTLEGRNTSMIIKSELMVVRWSSMTVDSIDSQPKRTPPDYRLRRIPALLEGYFLASLIVRHNHWVLY
jgi:hypothetical protein